MCLEYSAIDLESLSISTALDTGMTVKHLSTRGDRRWSGVCALSRFETLPLAVRARYDIYVVEGNVSVDGVELTLGGFLSCDGDAVLLAGFEGALVFLYRDEVMHTSGHERCAAKDLTWFAGGARGLQIAPLANTHHRLSLVLWQPHTHVHDHMHPYGEDIFILQGQLEDERGVYPSGSWLRFHPHSHHAPFAKQQTLILLRNGHLTE